MKSDLNELKKFVWNMARSGQPIPESELPAMFREHQHAAPAELEGGSDYDSTVPLTSATEPVEHQPIIIEPGDEYQEESIEESLSIADMEKQLIRKALEKHKGKRKDAALDLGISERTLYRKIKEYDVHA